MSKNVLKRMIYSFYIKKKTHTLKGKGRCTLKTGVCQMHTFQIIQNPPLLKKTKKIKFKKEYLLMHGSNPLIFSC